MPESEIIKAKNIGIWIDHREAVLVSVDGAQAEIERIESNVESRYRPSGGWKASGTNVAQAVSKEQKADERRGHQLASFYKAVREKAGGAEKLYVLGPGEAKVELVKKIEETKGYRAAIAAVEPCDRLTENQLIAKVKTFFST
jgi:hypothetical protein